MAIRIVDGVLGAGKTYFIVNWIKENLCIQLKDGSFILDPAKRVRLITNIDSLKIPHEDFRVLIEKAGGFDRFFDKDYQEKFSGDWSIIYVLDEAQEWLRPREKECKLSHKTKLYFEWCRHEGHDIWLITQHKTKIDKDVAELAENVISAQPRSNAIASEMTYISCTYEGVEQEVHRLFFSKETAALYQSSKKREFVKIKNPRIRRFLLAMAVSLLLLALGGRWAWRSFQHCTSGGSVKSSAVSSPAAAAGASSALVSSPASSSVPVPAPVSSAAQPSQPAEQVEYYMYRLDYAVTAEEIKLLLGISWIPYKEFPYPIVRKGKNYFAMIPAVLVPALEQGLRALPIKTKKNS